MSEPIKWSTTSDKDKTRLILEHVFGYFFVPERYVTYRGTLELPKGRDALPGFHWPVAYWDGGMVERWMIKDIGDHPRFFHPLRDLNHAWLLIEHIIDQNNDATVNLARWEEHEMCFWCLRKDELCNEICIAALRAVGVQVETEVQS